MVERPLRMRGVPGFSQERILQERFLQESLQERILQERFFISRKKIKSYCNGIGIGMYKFLTQLGQKTQVLMKNLLFYVSFPY